MPVSVSVHHLQAWCPLRPTEVIRVPGLGVTDDCNTMWVPRIKPMFLEEQPVPIT